MDTSVSAILQIVLSVLAVSSILFICVIKKRRSNRVQMRVAMEATSAALQDPAVVQQLQIQANVLANNPALVQQALQMHASILAKNPALAQQLQQQLQQMNPAASQQYQQFNTANAVPADPACPPPPAYDTVYPGTATNYSTTYSNLQMTNPNSTLGTTSAFSYN